LSKFVTLLHTREIETKLNETTPGDLSGIVGWLETPKQDETKPKQ